MKKLGNAASRAQLNPGADFANELGRLEAKIEHFETKLATQAESLVTRTAERLSQMLPYGKQIA